MSEKIRIKRNPVHTEGIPMSEMPYGRWYVLDSNRHWFYKRISQRKYVAIYDNEISAVDVSDCAFKALPLTEVDLEVTLTYQL